MWMGWFDSEFFCPTSSVIMGCTQVMSWYLDSTTWLSNVQYYTLKEELRTVLSALLRAKRGQK